MSANKKILGLVLVIFISSILITVPVNARICNPTSLKIWKTIEYKSVCGDSFTISGWIYIKNDPNFAAVILEIEDYVEAKYKDGPWTELNYKTISTGMTVKPGKTDKVWYSITFNTIHHDDETYTAFRNVVRVHLDNHPTGDKWYTYRLSFNLHVPILKIGQNIAPPSFWTAGTQKLIQIDVINDGSGQAEDVKLTVTIPMAELSGSVVPIFSIDETTGLPTISGNKIKWELGDIPAGGTASVSLKSTLDSRLTFGSIWEVTMVAEPKNGASHIIGPQFTVQ
jgi:hypothetical protein